ncbi:MAG: hypothetical protein ABEN55_19000, partial [Bradymonadaceae bacterium]
MGILVMLGIEFLTMYVNDAAATIRRFAKRHPELEWHAFGTSVKGDWDGFQIRYRIAFAHGPLDQHSFRDEDMTVVEVYFPADYQPSPTEVQPLPGASEIAPESAEDFALLFKPDNNSLAFRMVGTLENVDTCEELVDRVVAAMKE